MNNHNRVFYYLLYFFERCRDLCNNATLASGGGKKYFDVISLVFLMITIRNCGRELLNVITMWYFILFAIWSIYCAHLKETREGSSEPFSSFRFNLFFLLRSRVYFVRNKTEEIEINMITCMKNGIQFNFQLMFESAQKFYA